MRRYKQTCIICQIKFTTRDSKQTLCSDECKKERRKQITADSYKKNRQKRLDAIYREKSELKNKIKTEFDYVAYFKDIFAPLHDPYNFYSW